MPTRDTTELRLGNVKDAPNATYAFVTAFFEELARAGVEHVCVSPGSRSTPLAVAAGSIAGLTIWSHLDERSSAFFALGLAKSSRGPVALVCTSGTALVNYAPAVVEAHYSGVPLLILSADRPAELREWGAGQTIDQVKVFGESVRFYAELPIPEAGSRMLRYARALACRAVCETQGGNPGPVHLNWPLREPLAPAAASEVTDWSEGDAVALRGRENGNAYAHTESEEPIASAAVIEKFAQQLIGAERGLIACGVMDEEGFASAVTRLASLLGWPLLAEPTAGLRTGPHIEVGPIVATSDLFLRDSSFARQHAPDIVLRFGGTPVSKAYRLWLEATPPDTMIVVNARGEWNEPSHLLSDFVCANATDFCERLADAIEDSGSSAGMTIWLSSFLDAELKAQAVLNEKLAGEPALLEPRATQSLCGALPDDSILYVSNSMPVRDLDAFMPAGTANVRVLSNRGANGIDGLVSSALGAAAAHVGHTFLLTGDLAFLYDVGGLLAAQRYPLRATIVVFNNDGGGIFSFLPVAEYGEAVRFNELFNTPHGLDLKAVCASYGLTHCRVDSFGEYASAIEKSLIHSGVTVIEVPIDRDTNLAHFKDVVAAVSIAVASETEAAP